MRRREEVCVRWTMPTPVRPAFRSTTWPPYGSGSGGTPASPTATHGTAIPNISTGPRAALLRLLGEVGYGGLTVDAVAEEAGVGKATIYRRWRTKQDLIVDSISELGSVLTVPQDTGSLQEDIRQFMHLIVKVTRSPSGAMLHSLVSAMLHHPELRTATAQDR